MTRRSKRVGMTDRGRTDRQTHRGQDGGPDIDVPGVLDEEGREEK